MKKFYAILFVALMSFSAALATDPLPVSPADYSATYLNFSGAGQDDGSFNDLSYDEAEGQYCIYVICPLELYPINKQYINLGYINPDGSRGLSEEYMDWTVEGGNGWYFEAQLNNDQFSNESDDVYFVNPHWTYKKTGGSVQTYETSTELYISQLQLSGVVSENGCPNCDEEQFCSGGGKFTFYPNQVVATEIAVEGTYTWDVFLSVDYLTWTVPVMPNGDDYTGPQGTGVPMP